MNNIIFLVVYYAPCYLKNVERKDGKPGSSQ